MASRGPDRVPGPPVWLPACKVIALRLARSARPRGPSASDTSTSGTRLHRLHGGIGAVQSPGYDFADPLPPAQVRVAWRFDASDSATMLTARRSSSLAASMQIRCLHDDF